MRAPTILYEAVLPSDHLIFLFQAVLGGYGFGPGIGLGLDFEFPHGSPGLHAGLGLGLFGPPPLLEPKVAIQRAVPMNADYLSDGRWPLFTGDDLFNRKGIFLG